VTIADLPPEIRKDLQHARRLEIVTLIVMSLLVVIVGLAMGSSQAMQTAWAEDLLSLVPPAVFLFSTWLERKEANARFPFGYERCHGIAFLVAAVALVAVGGFLLAEAVLTLIRQERPTIGSLSLFGEEVWQGWIMIGALVIAGVPPVILGHLKRPIAERLADKVLYTDALMNKADWMTSLAGIAGLVGIGFGYWWADAAAAGVIAFDILHDGWKSARIAILELADSVPRKLPSAELSDDAARIGAMLRQEKGVDGVRMRETGRMIDVVIIPGEHAPSLPNLEAKIRAEWRVANLSIGSRVVTDAPAGAGDVERARAALAKK
jgi:cobalt-zinc-cadmium efflux system protein